MVNEAAAPLCHFAIFTTGDLKLSGQRTYGKTQRDQQAEPWIGKTRDQAQQCPHTDCQALSFGCDGQTQTNKHTSIPSCVSRAALW